MVKVGRKHLDTLPSDHVARPERVTVCRAADVAAFVVVPSWTGDPDEVGGIWYGPISGEPRRLVPIVPDSPLAFNADATALAYSVRDGAASTLVVQPVNAFARAPWSQTELTGRIESLCWASDGAVIVLLAPADEPPGVGVPGDARRDDSPSPGCWRRLVRVDPRGGAATVVSPPDLTIWEFALASDGHVVAVCGPEPGESGWYRAVLARFALGAEEYEVLHRPAFQLTSPTVSPDGRHVAFVTGWASDRGLLAGEPRIIDLSSGTVLYGPVVDADITWLSWQDERLWFAGWRHLGTAWGYVTRPYGPVPRTTLVPERAACLGSRWRPALAPTAESALTVRSTLTDPPEVTVLDQTREHRRWTCLNKNLGSGRRMRTRDLRWTGDDGTVVEGILATPTDGGDGPWPLVVEIHGGPTVAFHHGWDVGWSETLTAAGYAVLMPNPRGSAGRGQRFARANLGDPAGAEYTDIVAGVRRCVESGLVVAGQVAAMGSSYGGYLTAWAVARGTPWRCGIVTAGISNLMSCRNVADNPDFYDVLLGGQPSAVREMYAERSPVTRIGPWSSPALILHGELDRCVPRGQAEELCRGLRAAGRPVEMIVYPGEGHRVRDPTHIRHQRESVLSWLEAYLRPRLAVEERTVAL